MNYDILCFIQRKIIDYYLTLVQCISATCIFMMGARLQSINHGGKWLNVGCSWAYGGWGLLSKVKCEIVPLVDRVGKHNTQEVMDENIQFYIYM